MAEDKFYVYEHRRADTGEVFYVGKGQGKRAYSLANRNVWWHRIVEKHGRTVHFIADKLTEQEAFEREVVLISIHRAAGATLVNMTHGGEGVSGFRRAPESDETRARKRASAIGRRMSPEAIAKTVAFHTGRKRPPETLARMSAALKGKPPPPITAESRAKMAAANIGRKHSAETRAKMSASMRGAKRPPRSAEHCAKIAEARRKYWERWRAEKAAATATTE